MRRADIEVPNHPVDMDSWGRSACYPRGTFCPFSDGASTCHRRITSPSFRSCSTCLSHSQAPLCTYTRHLIANQAEGTFGRLRYLLGGNRPRLDIQNDQSGISPLTPQKLASLLHSLPPILHKTPQTPMSSCSEGPGVFPSCCA